MGLTLLSGEYLALGAGGFVLYLFALAFYRLYLSPIAKFPGPKLAALSNWYEFYYDVVRQGDFTWHINDLHKKYGPIVRITPTELHIDDPEYYDTLYTRGTGRRNKYAYFSGRFGYASDTFGTVDHDLHRQRRKAISPFFSVAKIADFQPVIAKKVDRLCDKLDKYAANGAVIPLNRAWMALTTDVITEYSFAKSYDQLESPDFADTLHEALIAIYVTGHFALHFPILFPILDMLPEWFVRWGQPEILPVLGLRKVPTLFPPLFSFDPNQPGPRRPRRPHPRRPEPLPPHRLAPHHLPRTPPQPGPARIRKVRRPPRRRSPTDRRRRPDHHLLGPLRRQLPPLCAALSRRAPAQGAGRCQAAV